MKKITTLFKIVYSETGSKGSITKEVRPENNWVFTEEDVVPTRKFDGTTAKIDSGCLYKRYDAKPTKEAFKKHIEGTKWGLSDFREVPELAIPCQEPDIVTGHYPHWIPCNRNEKSDKYFWEAFDKKETWEEGTYELCGEKVGTNAEKLVGHELIKHGSEVLPITDFSFESLKEFLELDNMDVEGIVFYGKDGKMCKLRKSDFGVKRSGKR